MESKLLLEIPDVEFDGASVVDRIGKVFHWQGRIFRMIYNVEDWAFYSRFVSSVAYSELTEAGLIDTWIPNDVDMKGCAGILEHKKIDFISWSAEWTLKMLWEAARVYCRCGEILAKHGMWFTDAHPWNILFDFCEPKMIDLGSISNTRSSSGWLDGIRTFFVIPLLLEKYGQSDLARNMMREHIQGFGYSLVKKRYIRNFPLKFKKLANLYNKICNESKSVTPQDFFRRLSHYIEKLEPHEKVERWTDYPQCNNDGSMQEKQKIVRNILKKNPPSSVIDMASNKGWYSFAAEELGNKVISFDYEEFCVNYIYTKARKQRKRILPLNINFIYPTPQSGDALGIPSSFDRLKCDISLSLAIIHHLAFKQNVQMDTIAKIIDKYTKKIALIEYIPTDDKHLRSWKKPIRGYSKENLVNSMTKKFNLESEIVMKNNRSILLFEKKKLI